MKEWTVKGLVFSLIPFFILFNAEFAIAQYTQGSILFAEHIPTEMLHSGKAIERFSVFNESKTATSTIKKDTVPLPRSVLFQSLIVPGWGQITNKQAWKIPFIYGALAGVGYYSYWLHTQYVDFRAAYYNSFAASNPEYADLRFGPTPARLVGAPVAALKSFRNYYRNERDFMLLMFGLTYGLNVIDAYIFAHLRDFDVSDELSLNAIPSMTNGTVSPVVTITYTFK